MIGPRKFWAILTSPPGQASTDLGDSFGWTGVVAAMIGSIGPLIQGLQDNWSTARLLTYSVMALLYLAMTQSHYLARPIFKWQLRVLWAYILSVGFVCLILQATSGDPFLQPIIFTVPLVYVAQFYFPQRMAWVTTFYLGLMTLGLWLSGERSPAAFIFPLIAYASFIAFVYVLIRLLVEQAMARRHADQLNQDIAQQRDYMARLVETTATLTRDLDVTTVLERIAAEGRTLAYAGQVRVWLLEDPPEEAAEPLVRLAAAVPAHADGHTPTVAEQHALLAHAAHVSDNRLVLPLVVKGNQIGALELLDHAHTPFSDTDIQTLQPFADVAAVVLENARLYEQARVSATLTERNRLARELHDTIAQGLTAVTMQLEAAQRVFERDPTRARTRIGRAHELARNTLEDVRRSVWTLASPLIDGHTLSASLEDVTQRFAGRTGIAASYQHDGPSMTLGHTAATQVLRIVQEALQNVEKHAQATQVAVHSEMTDRGVYVSVRDDGIGFAPGQPLPSTPQGSGFGLSSLHERARLAGGSLHIESTPGIGTQITVAIARTPELQHAEL